MKTIKTKIKRRIPIDMALKLRDHKIKPNKKRDKDINTDDDIDLGETPLDIEECGENYE